MLARIAARPAQEVRAAQVSAGSRSLFDPHGQLLLLEPAALRQEP